MGVVGTPRRPSRFEIATCAGCGSAFERATRSNPRRVCGAACRAIVYRRERPRVRIARDCRWCSLRLPEDVPANTRFHDECAKRPHVLFASGRRRALEHGRVVGRFDPVDVFVRDGWTCQLCLGLIDPLARRPNPLSPSLDHAVPITRGGDHVFENVRASHLICNFWKGDFTADQVAGLEWSWARCVASLVGAA